MGPRSDTDKRGPSKAEFLKSAFKEDDWPRDPKPEIAFLGRSNVGKSTLFNRLTGSRKAIVGDEPGITRDRIYGEVEWAGAKFSLIDTGGIVPDDDAVIPANILKQAGMAIDEAQVLIWVVDAIGILLDELA